MDDDGFISNIIISNTNTKPKKSKIDKKKEKKQKYLERKMFKRQNRKRNENKPNNVENKENKKYRPDSYRPSRRNISNNINNYENKNDDNKKEINERQNDDKKNEAKNCINTENKKEIEIEKKENIDFENNTLKEKKEDKKGEEITEEEQIMKENENKEIYKENEKEKECVKKSEKHEYKKNKNNVIEMQEEEKPKEKKEETENNIKYNKKINNKTSSQTIFSIKTFDELKINPYLKKALNKNNYNTMTKIQKKAIPILLEHKNVIVKSETGSGKTLAYMIPLYQNLIEINEAEKINRKNGVYSIIFSPTHELCLQIEKTFDKLKSCCINVVYGSLMGGQKIETEKKKLRKGLNIIITTPGRLLYHLQNTEKINFTTLKMIIIDEADLMLDIKNKKDIKECFKLMILKNENIDNNEEIVLNPDLFKKFKIFLISATIDNRIRKMSNYFMKGFKAIGFEKEDEKDKEIKNDNKDKDIDKNNEENNNEEEDNNKKVSSTYYLSSLKQRNITQYFSYINDEFRLIHLIAFLYNNLFQKTIIFVSTCYLCEYLSKIITELEIDINYKSDIEVSPKDKQKSSKDDSRPKNINLFTQKTYKLHGKMRHDERKIVFNEFNEDNSGILIATDVAARGLDFKNVNWVIHYDINPDIKEYINRIGRTARIDNIGSSIIFLMQNERKLLDSCFKPIKNHLNEIKNSDILISFIKNINKNILKNKINDEDNRKNNVTLEDSDIIDENEIYRKKYLFAISPILRCIKNFIFKDKNNLIMARKAFKSEVRSYVTFLKYAKDVFNVKALNLTRMSRSFGLYKESLSMKVGNDQVNIDYQIDKKEKFTQKKFLNKKIQNRLIYSEFE